jgi:hypothetical protein
LALAATRVEAKVDLEVGVAVVDQYLCNEMVDTEVSAMP